MIHQYKGYHKTPTFKAFEIPENLSHQKRTKTEFENEKVYHQ